MGPAGDTLLDRFFYRNTRAYFFPLLITTIIYKTYYETWLATYRP